MEQQNSMQPQMNMQGPENGQYVPGYDTQANMSPYVVQQMRCLPIYLAVCSP